MEREDSEVILISTHYIYSLLFLEMYCWENNGQCKLNGIKKNSRISIIKILDSSALEISDYFYY